MGCLLEGRVAIVTGGGKGIGYGIASKMAEHGANIFITGRTEGRLAEAAEKLNSRYRYGRAQRGHEPLGLRPAVARLRRAVPSARTQRVGVLLWNH